MFFGFVKIIFGFVRFEVNNNWFWVVVNLLCSYFVVNINVIVGDMNVENFFKFEDFFGDIFFGCYGYVMYF